MPDRGKLVVFSFFLLAAVLAGGAMWYHFAKTRWAMGFWGNDAARLIVRAPEVEAWRLAEVPDFGDVPTESSQSFRNSDYAKKIMVVDGAPMYIAARRPLMAAPGLIHMRMALVEDANFDTQATAPLIRVWDYAFLFSSPDEELIVLIDSQRGLVRALVEPETANEPIATITPIASGLKRFLEEQFKETQKKPEQPEPGLKEPAALETVPEAK